MLWMDVGCWMLLPLLCTFFSHTNSKQKMPLMMILRGCFCCCLEHLEIFVTLWQTLRATLRIRRRPPLSASAMAIWLLVGIGIGTETRDELVYLWLHVVCDWCASEKLTPNSQLKLVPLPSSGQANTERVSLSERESGRCRLLSSDFWPNDIYHC